MPNVTFEAPSTLGSSSCAVTVQRILITEFVFCPIKFSFNNLLMKPVSDVSRNSTSASVKAIQTATTCGWTSFRLSTLRLWKAGVSSLEISRQTPCCRRCRSSLAFTGYIMYIRTSESPTHILWDTRHSILACRTCKVPSSVLCNMK